MASSSEVVATKTQTSITEGSATIESEGHVFYNPVQEFNRDLSLSVLSTFSEIYQEELSAKNKVSAETTNAFDGLRPGEKCENGLTVLEALSATGLRSIRYAKEVKGIKEIVANDLSISAVKQIEHNVDLNGVRHLITPCQSDATTLMYNSTSPEKRFTAIDLDPYGSPTIFLDGAVQSLADGGLLLVTATDLAVLAGNTPESCFLKYGAISLKTKACHEQALRILIRCIESHATRYGRHIKPLLSISADFYIRVFVRIFTSPLQCKMSSSKQSTLYQCTGCMALVCQPLGILKPNPTPSNPNQVKYCLPVGPFVKERCDHCHHRYHIGGPIWTDPIHDPSFLNRLLNTIEREPFKKLTTHNRILGVLTVVNEELHDIPLYYSIDRLCSTLKLVVIPTLKFRSALLHANYRTSFSHASKSAIKTDAPMEVLWDILRCWAKLNPVKPTHFENNLVLKAILSKEPAQQYNVQDIHPDANPDSRKNSLSRFPLNPAAHWGPGTRATLMVGDNKMLKSVRNQNKNKHKRTTSSDDGAEKKQVKMDEE